MHVVSQGEHFERSDADTFWQKTCFGRADPPALILLPKNAIMWWERDSMPRGLGYVLARTISSVGSTVWRGRSGPAA